VTILEGLGDALFLFNATIPFVLVFLLISLGLGREERMVLHVRPKKIE